MCVCVFAGYREGYLWKRGRDNGQFLSRKFILSEREGALKYYNKQDVRKSLSPLSLSLSLLFLYLSILFLCLSIYLSIYLSHSLSPSLSLIQEMLYWHDHNVLQYCQSIWAVCEHRHHDIPRKGKGEVGTRKSSRK